MIAIVDYAMGNVSSVANMLKKIGATQTVLTRDPEVLRRADKVILPGVGAFDNGMRNLEEFGLLDALNEVALERRVPVLGICLGMHLLTKSSEEGKRPGLGWLDASTARFRFEAPSSLKVPHMGWNYVRLSRENPLIQPNGESRFYFVHSYYVTCNAAEDMLATANYGFEFACAVNHGNVYGVQFHPEKSHRFGMALFRGFVDLQAVVLKRIMPCLLFDGQALVKTARFRNPAYIGDPINAIKIYNEKEVDELVMLDINASKEKRPPRFDRLRDCASECFMPFSYGGGVATLDDFARLFELGVEKVIVNTRCFVDPDVVRAATDRYGASSIVGAVDYKNGLFGGPRVYSAAGARTTRSLQDHCRFLVEDLGVGELLLSSVERDGTWSGYDLPTIRAIAKSVSVPLIASGGAGNVGHLRQVLRETDANGAAVGSMAVYQKQGMGVLISFPDRDLIIEDERLS